ncbi:MAG: hypothetical protein APF81_13715 [Desulfosporosinus sp. BRH_c37]|nr:MAG: hypothetical protein APF81_13715 [Desulfosporosinus sp. BRH_c37]
MGIKNKKNIFIVGFVIIAIGALTVYSVTSNKYIFGQNFTKYLKQATGKTIMVQKELKVTYYEKNFVVILSTRVDQKNELYANCFEEKLGGLFYKPAYGAMQGESRSLYGMMINFIKDDGSDSNFKVVYGYNKDFKAISYEVKKANNEIIKEDISDQDYFLKTYQDIVYPAVTFENINNEDITNFFIYGI